MCFEFLGFNLTCCGAGLKHSWRHLSFLKMPSSKVAVATRSFVADWPTDWSIDRPSDPTPDFPNDRRAVRASDQTSWPTDCPPGRAHAHAPKGKISAGGHDDEITLSRDKSSFKIPRIQKVRKENQHRTKNNTKTNTQKRNTHTNTKPGSRPVQHQ